MSVDDLQARLARKALAAKDARARHKSHVQCLQEEVNALAAKAAQLENERLAATQAATQQLRDEIKSALPSDRWETLNSWLRDATVQASKPVLPQPETILCALSRPPGRPEGTSLLQGGAGGPQRRVPSRVGNVVATADAASAPARSWGRSAAASAAALSSMRTPTNASGGPNPKQFLEVDAGSSASAMGGGASILLRGPSEASPTSVMADDDLLACALQGIVGLAHCTPRLQPSPAPPMPPTMSLPPPASRQGGPSSVP